MPRYDANYIELDRVYMDNVGKYEDYNASFMCHHIKGSFYTSTKVTATSIEDAERLVHIHALKVLNGRVSGDIKLSKVISSNS
jgi:hypothetical protein